MSSKVPYQGKYDGSWALVIGIDDYAHCSPLSYACNDARAVAAALIDRFDFPVGNVEILLDGQATKAAIMKALLRHAGPTARPDERGLVFFAGHGETISSRRGEVGYLVPADGDCDDLSSLIRWDDLTRNGDLLPAKHVLFIMDACYGGLAVTRHVHPGSRRFLRDMLRRHARQVLAAGKADEEVADGDGPRAGHSLFTGHLLDALDGAAAKTGGFITANAVMAYVYDRVSKDQRSQQTPHYGFIDGDGDFIFSRLPDDLPADDAKGGSDVLVEVPADLDDQVEGVAAEQSEKIKEYLSEPRHRIRLDDLVNGGVRKAMKLLSGDAFPLSTDHRKIVEDFPKRVAAYEEAVRPLQSTAILLGKWADPEQRNILANMFARMADSCPTFANGLEIWIGLRWQPISYLLYAGGIAALSAGNYANLAAMHTVKVESRRRGNRTMEGLIVPVVDGLLQVQQTEIWKRVPGHERNYAPYSEYMFKRMQPVIEDMLFLGTSYEHLFDRYEVLRALIFADLEGREERVWGPLGRFAWKYSGRMGAGGDNPFSEVCREAEERGDRWPPIKAGLFQGSYSRFRDIASRFEKDLLSRLNWL